VTKAMSFDPKERFPTAQDMAQAISGGPEESPGFPHLVVLGKKCKVKRAMEIGRDHKSCDQSCTKKGFGRPPEIGILDGERYLSKHHARILKDPKGRCWIEDLGSLNGTAMSHDGGRTYRQIRGFKREELTDGDVVALVYKPGRGPYMTIAFKGGRRHGRTQSRRDREPDRRPGRGPNAPPALDERGGHPTSDILPRPRSRRGPRESGDLRGGGTASGMPGDGHDLEPRRRGWSQPSCRECG